MNFYLLPLSSYNAINPETVLVIESLIKELVDHGDSFIVPVDFYTTQDKDHFDFTSIIETSYTVNHDELSLLVDLVFKSKTSDLTYEELFEIVRTQNDVREEYTGFIKDSYEDESPVNRFTTTDEKTLRIVYRNIAASFDEYGHLYDWRERCFPQLLFTKYAFENSEKIGSYRENFCEIQKCLAVLNDEGQKLYQKRTEDETISALQSTSGVRCSGKGANESSTFKKKVRYRTGKSRFVEFEISCIPHFKLDNAYSDKRLHFSWGRDEIEKHKIIVVHIGEHWKKENGVLSVIE